MHAGQCRSCARAGGSASIAGTITDSQGGVLPGVTLTVTNAESGTVRTSVTEADGKYRVAGLAPGRYNLTAELPGFQTVEVKDITLQIGQEYARDFQIGALDPPGIGDRHRRSADRRGDQDARSRRS